MQSTRFWSKEKLPARSQWRLRSATGHVAPLYGPVPTPFHLNGQEVNFPIFVADIPDDCLLRSGLLVFFQVLFIYDRLFCTTDLTRRVNHGTSLLRVLTINGIAQTCPHHPHDGGSPSWSSTGGRSGCVCPGLGAWPTRSPLCRTNAPLLDIHVSGPGRSLYVSGPSRP